MPQLDNPRWERFAIFIAKGETLANAYRKAGYKTQSKDACTKNAGRLKNIDEVAVRIKELQNKAADNLGIDVDLIIAELDDARQLAIKQKHPAAAVGATIAKAKLLGLIVDRPEVDSAARRPMREPTDVKRMSLTEWQDKFAPKTLKAPLKKRVPDDGAT